MDVKHNTKELYKRDSNGKIRVYSGQVGEENGLWYTRAVTGINEGKMV